MISLRHQKIEVSFGKTHLKLKLTIPFQVQFDMRQVEIKNVQKIFFKKKKRRLTTHLISLRHQKVEVSFGKAHLQIGFDEAEIGRVPIQAVDAHHQMQARGVHGAAVVRHLLNKPYLLQLTYNTTLLTHKHTINIQTIFLQTIFFYLLTYKPYFYQFTLSKNC